MSTRFGRFVVPGMGLAMSALVVAALPAAMSAAPAGAQIAVKATPAPQKQHSSVIAPAKVEENAVDLLGIHRYP
jgi:hypothetical protein